MDQDLGPEILTKNSENINTIQKECCLETQTLVSETNRRFFDFMLRAKCISLPIINAQMLNMFLQY